MGSREDRKEFYKKRKGYSEKFEADEENEVRSKSLSEYCVDEQARVDDISLRIKRLKQDIKEGKGSADDLDEIFEELSEANYDLEFRKWKWRGIQERLKGKAFPVRELSIEDLI